MAMFQMGNQYIHMHFIVMHMQWNDDDMVKVRLTFIYNSNGTKCEQISAFEVPTKRRTQSNHTQNANIYRENNSMNKNE